MLQVDLFTRHRALTNSKGFASFEDPEGELGGGNSIIFGIFTPKKGENEPILTCAYFFEMGGQKPPTI